MTLSKLYALRQVAQDQLTSAKLDLANIDCLILSATKEKANQMYALAGKQFGTVNVAGEDGISIKADISKKVEWDSDKLADIARTMSWDAVKANFKMEFSVPEKVYAGLGDAVKLVFDAARTVKYGDIKITLEKK